MEQEIKITTKDLDQLTNLLKQKALESLDSLGECQNTQRKKSFFESKDFLGFTEYVKTFGFTDNIKREYLNQLNKNNNNIDETFRDCQNNYSYLFNLKNLLYIFQEAESIYKIYE